MRRETMQWNTVRKNLSCVLVPAVCLLFAPAAVVAQVDYTLQIGSGACNAGESIPISTSLLFSDTAANVSGVSYGVCHDTSVVSINCVGGIPNDCVDNGIIAEGADLAATNGGSGAAFFAPATSTMPLDGFTIGIVVNLLGTDSLPNTPSAEIVVTTYECVADGTSPLTLCETGSPLVLLSIGILGGGDVVPDAIDGEIVVGTPPMPMFIRGDVNGDGSLTGIVDAVCLIGTLSMMLTIPCADAADANDDGVVDMADVLFILEAAYNQPGPSIPSPFPDCGSDDVLGCALPPCP